MLQYITEFFKELYRVGPDRPNVWIYDWTDWVTVIAIALMIRQVLAHYSRTTHKKRMRAVLTAVLCMHLLSRYVMTPQFYDFGSRLPFYSCSLSAIIFVLSAFWSGKAKWQQLLTDWAAFAGIYGGVLAIGFSSPGVYMAPHITLIDYYLGHALIIFFGAAALIDRDTPYSRETLLRTTGLTMAYLLFCYILNFFLDTNFGFLRNAPPDIPFLGAVPPLIYRLGVAVAYASANILVCLLANRYIRQKATAAQRAALEAHAAEASQTGAAAPSETNGLSGGTAGHDMKL